MRFAFEFDESKNRANESKHGIDFVEAQGLWLDPDLLRLPARSDAEPRSCSSQDQGPALVGDHDLSRRDDQADLCQEIAHQGGAGV